MKKITFIAIVGCIMSAISLTSCNSDSESSYKDLTAAEIQQCFNATRGNHNGKMIYAALNKANVADKFDTISIAWSIINDSTMTIYDFPAKALAEKITGKDELKEALASQPDRTLKCAISYVNANPIQFLVGPSNLTYELNYGGKHHKVEIRFYWNTYSFGQYSSSSKHPMQMQIWAALLKVDGNETSYGITIDKPAQFFFYTEK